MWHEMQGTPDLVATGHSNQAFWRESRYWAAMEGLQSAQNAGSDKRASNTVIGASATHCCFSGTFIQKPLVGVVYTERLLHEHRNGGESPSRRGQNAEGGNLSTRRSVELHRAALVRRR